MLLTIETTSTAALSPATDFGYLLHKNPTTLQSFDVGFGVAHVFYPAAAPDRCQVAVLLEIDPIGLVRNRPGPPGDHGRLDQYVNDRPFVASSFLSVAMNRLFASAMNGRSRERPELVDTPLPLRATVDVVASRGGRRLLDRLFEPLGYAVTVRSHELDQEFAHDESEFETDDCRREPEGAPAPASAVGDRRRPQVCHSLTIEGTLPLGTLLRHLYVLLPVLDDDKHYWVGDDEVAKLLDRGRDWLADHPERELIASRYLRRQMRLTRSALARLADQADGDPDGDPDGAIAAADAAEERIERPLSLNAQRIGSVVATLKACGATSVVDLGCGEGNLLRELLPERCFQRIVGVDVSLRALERAEARLRLDRLPEAQRSRLRLLHGSLTYRDARLVADGGFDAAALVEVIEHLDPPRLRALERCVFGHARPRTVVVTTPNREYNVRWPAMPVGAMRHRDHRFEWTRSEFAAWAERAASAHGYHVRFAPVGPEDPEVGAPTQMGVFDRE